MADRTTHAHLLIATAQRLAEECGAVAIVAALSALPSGVRLPASTRLLIRSETERAQAIDQGHDEQSLMEIPEATLDRLGQVRLAAVVGLSMGHFDLGQTILCLTGPAGSTIDTLVIMSFGQEFELFDAAVHDQMLEHTEQAVFFRLLSLAFNIGHFGREGRPMGTVFVLGDNEAVSQLCEQMVLNPFKGYPEQDRNVLDDRIVETVKEFSAIDGAFVIQSGGVIEAAGARLQAADDVGLPAGLGARHAAAAGITAVTKAIAISVSESDGSVRVWRAGRMVAQFDSSRR